MTDTTDGQQSIDGLEPKGPEPKDPEPKETPPSKRGTGRPPGRPAKIVTRAAKVEALYRSLGAGLQFGAVLDPRLLPIGLSLDAEAPALGRAWAEWAETSARVAKLIDDSTFGGAAIGVLIAHVPIAKACYAALTMPVTTPRPEERADLADLSDMAERFATAADPNGRF